MTNDLNKDPSIERWAATREHTHFYYRFNRQKLLPTVILLGIIPAGIAYASLKGFVSENVVGILGLIVCRIGMSPLEGVCG